MKKFIYAIVFVLVFTLPVHAQFRLGLKGGVNVSTVTFDKEVINPSNITGFQAGAIAEIMFGPVGIEGGALYSQHGFQYEELKTGITGDETVNHKTKSECIDIPLNIKFKVGLPSVLKFYVQGGPYFRFQIAGDNLIQDLKSQWESKTFQTGLNAGAGIEILSHFQVGFNYSFGLTDNYASDNNSSKDRTWSITAAYFF